MEELETQPLKKTVCSDYFKLRRELKQMQRENGLDVKEKFNRLKKEFLLAAE